ncbi:MAG: hypothetical protein AB7L84_03375 [Acidimicrobiia bacterium]
MSRRIDIELTSLRDDSSWTWRAAGAREPKGVIGGELVPAGAKAGDVLKVEADFFVDGISIVSVVPPKGERREPERLELLRRSTDEPLVISNVSARADGDRRGGGRGRPRRDGERDRRPARDGERERRPRAERPGRDGGGGESRERPRRSPRPAPPPMPAVERPKAKRLRPGRVHRKALLDSLPDEQRPIAEQLLSGGLPAVRAAIAKQNEERAASGEEPIAEAGLVGLAERLWPRVRVADWRDRAEAALADVDELDLRDLRSVVSQSEGSARDEDSRAVAAQLREALAVRVDKEHSAWLAELAATLEVGRVVRALRVSSRPPKAGAPLPAELTNQLTAAAGAALTADAGPDRWIAVLDALALSPVRDRVIPESLPVDLADEVRSTIARLATRIPKVAHIFEITPDPTIPRPRPERRKPRPTRPAGGEGRRRSEEGRRADPQARAGSTDAETRPESTDAGAVEARSDGAVESTVPEVGTVEDATSAEAPVPGTDGEAVATRSDEAAESTVPETPATEAAAPAPVTDGEADAGPAPSAAGTDEEGGSGPPLSDHVSTPDPVGSAGTAEAQPDPAPSVAGPDEEPGAPPAVGTSDAPEPTDAAAGGDEVAATEVDPAG